MVAFEPNLSQIFKAAVGGDLLRRQVAVVVNNRHSRRVVVVEPPCGFGLEQKIVVEKGFHF
jgi:hypothetical protein